jgi:hypothetical protein
VVANRYPPHPPSSALTVGGGGGSRQGVGMEGIILRLQAVRNTKKLSRRTGGWPLLNQYFFDKILGKE